MKLPATRRAGSKPGPRRLPRRVVFLRTLGLKIPWAEYNIWNRCLGFKSLTL